MKNLEVKYGTIYNEDGVGYDNVSVIIDRNGGMLKWGRTEGMDNYYTNMINKYKQCGFNDMADDIILLSFDRYDGILNIDEICVFLNYMIQCSANGEAIMKMLEMEEEQLKNKLKELNTLGF